MLRLPTELLVPLFFVVALIMLSRLRADIWREQREAFRYVAAGISILALTSLLKLYFEYGYLNEVPFLSDPLFHRVLVWVGTILGTVCVSTGISIWLQHRRARNERDRVTIRRLETLKKLVQLVGVETRPEHLLERALGYIAEGFQLPYGAIYRLSARRNVLHLTTASPWADFRFVQTAVRFDRAAWARVQSGSVAHTVSPFDNLNPRLGKPSLVVPLLIERKPVAFMLVWAGESAVDESTSLDLRLAADVLARSIHHDLDARKCRYFHECAKLRAELRGLLSARGDLTAKLSRLAIALRRKLHCDLVTLTMVNRRAGRIRRYTWGPSENPLIENRSITTLPDSIGDVLRMPAGRSQSLGQSISPQVPVIARHGSGAVLSFAPAATRSVSHVDLGLLRVAADIFAELLRRDHERRLRLRFRQQAAKLATLGSRLSIRLSVEREGAILRDADVASRSALVVPGERYKEPLFFEDASL
ncbi:MAG: hypothetical protein AB1644_01845 [Candidatus Zixiibacteriota bacterium]